MRKYPQIQKSIAGLLLLALAFVFFTESLGTFIFMAFSHHSHETRVLKEHGKTRLSLVHDQDQVHDVLVVTDGITQKQHSDHEFQFVDQDTPFLLAANSEAPPLSLVFLARVSFFHFAFKATSKPISPSFDPRPHPLLIRVRSVVILV